MKILAYITIIVFTTFSCRVNDEKLQYKMSGIYDFISVKQERYEDNQLVETLEENLEGKMVLRQGKTEITSPYEIILEPSTINMIAWEEIEEYFFDTYDRLWWDGSWDERRVALCLEPSNPFTINWPSLTFTVTKSTKRKKELMYLRQTEENGVVVQVFEYYTLRLRN